MATRRKSKVKKYSSKVLKEKLLRMFIANPKKRYSAKQLKKKLKIDNSSDSVKSALGQLVKEKKVLQLKDYLYKSNKEVLNTLVARTLETYQGRVDMTKRGAGYIIVDGLEDDVYVSPKNLMSAMDNDKVLVSLFESRKGRRAEGRVVDIVERNLKQVVGKFRKFRKFAIVQSKGKAGLLEVYIKPEKYNNAEDGDDVLAKITSFGKGQNKGLWGNVAKILTETDAHNLAMQQIIVENGFDLEFPKHVIKASKQLNVDISDQEIQLRKDLRKVTTLTIDPLTAQDFDDALSVRTLENGNIEIGVHIADVSHYVQEESEIDKEAFNRSTSVYLVDRCIPMLPEILSNKLCSLRPNEDSLTFSVLFEFDSKLKIVNEWFGKTIIYSDHRFTYEEAQEVIESKEGDYSEELLTLNKIAKHLRKQKFKNGAIAFESDEIQFKLDDENKPVEIYVKQRKDAHMLVEDFMLLANKSVATYIIKKSKEEKEVPFVYRVHDEPNLEKLADFGKFAKEMGVPMKLDTPSNVAKSFNELAKKSKENESLALLQPLAIRTMAKAIYTTDNIGHYGLAFDNYSHFTSPIRRYSDLLVHRVLFKNLDGQTTRVSKSGLEAKCSHISNMEKKAMTAERESIKYKQVEFLKDKIGEEFIGFISGMLEIGIFVELKESKAEGLIRFDQFKEPYEIASSKMYATGLKSGIKLRMGTKVRVELVDADMELRQIDMNLLEIIE